MKFLGIEDKALEAKVLEIHAEAVKLAAKPAKKYCGRESLGNPKRAQFEGTEFLDRLQIEFSPRLATCAGRAEVNYLTGAIKIKLHYRLLKDNHKELRATYLHELAHILAAMWYGYSCGHDDNWRQVAVLLGDDGGRCHSMDVSAFRRPGKRYAYRCSCQEYQLSPAKHRNALRVFEHYGYMPYSCKLCKSRLVHVQQPVITKE